jgi:hypothetical protein
VRINRKKFPVDLEVLALQQIVIFGTKHSRNVLSELLDIAVVVRPFNQNVLTAQFHTWYVLHALFKLVGGEVVLKNLVKFETLYLKYEFLHNYERPREVEPTHGPLCVALKECLRVSKSFLDEFPLSARE